MPAVGRLWPSDDDDSVIVDGVRTADNFGLLVEITLRGRRRMVIVVMTMRWRYC